MAEAQATELSKKRKQVSEEVEDEVGEFTSSMDSIRNHSEALINIIANPSLKINNTNQKELCRIIYAIIEQAMVQNNAINFIMGRLLEQREITKMVLEQRESRSTYAEVAKREVRKRSLSCKREDTVIALIYPNNESESENTREEVKRNINLVNLGMGIKRVKKINKGGILMELDNNVDYDKLEVEILTNENLRENYTIKKTTKLKPKIIVYDVHDELDDDEIVTSIAAQNDLPMDTEIKIEFSMKGKRGRNIIISLNPEPFKQLIKRGKINLKWSRYNVREFIKPIQCFNCYRYGHLAKYCKNKSKCRNCCSEEHQTDDCQEDTHCLNCHQYNSRFNTKHDTHHNVRDRSCLIFENELIKLHSRIDYGSTD